MDFDSVKSKLNSDKIRLPHQAVEIAFEVFYLSSISKELSNDQSRKLIGMLCNSLVRWEKEDILTNQIEYAIRLARSDGDLIYEEMHKLYSLCDEVHALQKLGLFSQTEDISEFDEAIRNRLRNQKKLGQMVVDDKAEEWNRHLWWYQFYK